LVFLLVAVGQHLVGLAWAGLALLLHLERELLVLCPYLQRLGLLLVETTDLSESLFFVRHQAQLLLTQESVHLAKQLVEPQRQRRRAA
jgi:hypothetical protein